MGTRELDACAPAAIPMERLAAYAHKSGGKYGVLGRSEGYVDCSVRQQLADSYSHFPEFEYLNLRQLFGQSERAP